MSTPRATVRVVSRRKVLVGAAAVGAAAVLEACADGVKDDSGSPDLGGLPGTDQDVVQTTPVTPNDEHYITSCCGTASVDVAVWTLTFLDRGRTLATLDWPALTAMQGRDKEHTLECISASPYNQAMGNAVWHGLPLPEILTALGVTVPDSALEVKFTSEDGYTTSVPVSDIAKPMWLVWKMNGVDIPAEHGYPARLLTPGRYGMKNPKWIAVIEFIDEPYIGYWESYGWSNDALYQPNAFFRNPRQSFQIDAGPMTAFGTAFAGSDPVVRVEVSIDDGGTWADAVIDYSPGADIWVLWHFDWEATAGELTLHVRCTTASGAMSDPSSTGTGELSGYNGSMTVDVTVV
jgi:hypothetical protein